MLVDAAIVMESFAVALLFASTLKYRKTSGLRSGLSQCFQRWYSSPSCTKAVSTRDILRYTGIYQGVKVASAPP